jgi:pyrroline-5-carboxylate reductase
MAGLVLQPGGRRDYHAFFASASNAPLQSSMHDLPLQFLGGGNMADAIIAGLLASGHDAERILVVEPEPARATALRNQHGVTVVAPGAPLKAEAVTVLAVKPQVAAEALAATPVPAGALVVSIAAGLSCDWLRSQLSEGVRVARCMPNTPARLGAGVTGIWADTDIGEAARAQIDYLLGAAGATVWLESEAQIDAVTALSGSGPAYVFALGEAMAAAGQQLGLPQETAEELARQTLIGAGRLLAEETATAGELRARVTSAGGTTAAALAELEAGGLSALMARAMAAAAERARELSAPPTHDEESEH